MAKNLLRVYYCIVFFYGLSHSFFFATYVVFLTQAGLSLMEVNLVNCFFMAGCFLFEIPTGGFADTRGRKFSFVAACFIFSLSMFMYFLAGSFTWFVIAELLGALATTFYSGAFDAWIIDSLIYYKRPHEIRQVIRRKFQINQAGVLGGVVCGSYLGGVNIAWPWLASSLGMLIIGIFSIFAMQEEYFVHPAVKTRNLAQLRTVIIESVGYGFRNRSVFNIMIAGFLLCFACMAPNMYWQVLFSKQFGFSVQNLGYVHAATMIVLIIGSSMARRVETIFGSEKNGIIASLAVIAVGLIVVSLCGHLAMVFFGFYLHELARGSYIPLKENYFNSRIPSAKRATILSVDQMVNKAGAFLGLLTSGWLAENISFSAAWLWPALFILICLPILLIMPNGE